ncbi:MAG: hypothetical protein IKL46_00145 [Clostridia bacterium]|nr:hypothetical protein [Clostridia bacterium]
MKVLKRAEQKNFIIDKDMYSKHDIENLMYQGFVFWFDENMGIRMDVVEGFKYDETVFRINAVNIDEIKVVYNKEYGFYETVAILYNGDMVHITL